MRGIDYHKVIKQEQLIIWCTVCFDLTTFVVSRYCVIGEIILETGAQHRQSIEYYS